MKDLVIILLYLIGSFFAFGQGTDTQLDESIRSVFGAAGWFIVFVILLAVFALSGWR